MHVQEGADAHDPGSDWSGDSEFAARLRSLVEGADAGPAEPAGGWDAWQSDSDGYVAGEAGAGEIQAPTWEL